jgi:hypothetical protein
MNKNPTIPAIASLTCTLGFSGTAIAQTPGTSARSHGQPNPLYVYSPFGANSGANDLMRFIGSYGENWYKQFAPDPIIRDASNAVPAFEYGFGYFYASNSDNRSELLKIDPFTGTTTTISLTNPLAGDRVLTSLEFVGSTLYGGLAHFGNPAGPSDLVTIDITTGAMTNIGAMGIGSPTGGLTYNRGQMYTVNSGAGGAATLYTVDLLTGAATSVGDVQVGGTGIALTGLEFSLRGTLYGLGRGAHDNVLFSIDPTTGSAIFDRTLDPLLISGAGTTLTTPTPSSIALIAAGGMFAGMRRRR